MIKNRKNDPGYGIEYEILTPAYFALVLNNDSGVDDFTLTSNAENFGNLDDVLIRVQMQNVDYHFGIQLKHKEEAKKLLPSSFEAKGDFNLEKYCKEFKNLRKEHKKYHFILYTNKDFNNERKEEVKNFKMVQDDPSVPNILLNTSGDKQNMYRFEVINETVDGENVTREDYQQFLPQFSLYVCQKNFKQLKIEIKKILKYEEIFLKYINFFRRLHQGQFTNKSLDKRTLNLHLIDMFFSPFIIEDWNPPFEKKKKLIFEAAISEFDVTVINGLNFNPNIKYEDTAETTIKLPENYVNKFNTAVNNIHELMTKYLLRVGKDYKIINRFGKTLEQSEKMKILCYFFEKPLYIRVDQAPESYVYDAINLYKVKENKMKFVFLGQKLEAEQIPNFKIFKNLGDLMKCSRNLYQNLIKNCRLSLQGRTKISLQHLIDSNEEICRCIELVNIFKMLEEECNIGDEKEKLPQYHIPRVVSRSLLDLNSVLNQFSSKSIGIFIFINCDDKFLALLRDLKLEVSKIDDILNSDKVPSKNIIVISYCKDCPKRQFDKICQKNVHVHLFEIISQEKCILIKSTTNHFDSNFIEENQIHVYFNSSVHLLCAQPGMGKTTTMKCLKNSCPSDFWTVFVELKTHNTFLKMKHIWEEILEYFLNLNEEQSLLEHIKRLFLKRKKIAFFLDGVDELDSDCVDNIINFIKELLFEGFLVWVSSRPNLQNPLESDLNTFSIDIKELSKQQQTIYIYNRLQNAYLLEEIHQIVERTFVNINIINNCQILGIPLQLYMLTEIFLRDRSFYETLNENMCVLTKMYKIFFEERCKDCLTQKVGCQNIHLLPVNLEDYLENYEIPALQSCLEEDVFKKLSIDLRRSERFLKDLDQKGDRIGIITKIGSDNKPIFDHYTYGEYFACQFFANNFEKARLLREHLFSEKYQNLMLMFNIMLAEENPLHLAVIRNNVEQIDKYIDTVKVHDRGGRNPLHLACFNMTRFTPRPLDPETYNFGRDGKETDLNKTVIFKLQKFDAFELDMIFEWTPIHYSLEMNSYFLSEVVLKNQANRYQFDNILDDDEVRNLDIAYFCSFFTYPNLLSVVLNKGGPKFLQKIHQNDIFSYVIRHQMFSHSETGEDEMETIKLLINNCNDINASLKMPLHSSVEYSHNYATKLLLKKGAHVNTIDECGESILHYAGTSYINDDLIGNIVEKSSNVNIANKNGKTPLHYAAIKGKVLMTKSLLDKSAKINIRDRFGYTPLHYAISNRHIKVVKLLVEKNADVNIRDQDGLSPLRFAARMGDFETFKIFYEFNKKINVTFKHGLTTLHYAVQRRYNERMDFLLKYRLINLSASCEFDISPLHYPSKIAAVGVVEAPSGNGVKLLLNIDITIVNSSKSEKTKRPSANDVKMSNKQKSILNSDTFGKNANTIKVMLDDGTWVEVTYKEIIKILYDTASVGSVEMVKLLLDNGASVNAVTDAGDTPLHYASLCYDNTEIINLLLRKGAKINARNNKGETPLDYTTKRYVFDNYYDEFRDVLDVEKRTITMKFLLEKGGISDKLEDHTNQKENILLLSKLIKSNNMKNPSYVNSRPVSPLLRRENITVSHSIRILFVLIYCLFLSYIAWYIIEKIIQSVIPQFCFNLR